MAERTGIQWTDHTHNPWSGCTKISAGCANCYAANLPPAMRRHAIWGDGGQRVRASDAYLRQPFAWDQKAEKDGVRRRVFCASVADVFEARPELDRWRDHLMATIALTPSLDWQLLTKRPEYAVAYLSNPDLYERVLTAANQIRQDIPRLNRIPISDPTHGLAAWWPNLWIGTSVENQEAADTRIPHLLKIPAAVRFLSMEPLLGPVDVSQWLSVRPCACDAKGDVNPFRTCSETPCAARIGWAIIGGESGNKARPMHPDWARKVRDQCIAAGVPFFFKQWGMLAPGEEIDAAGNGWAGMYECDPRDGGAPRFYVHTDGHRGQDKSSAADAQNGWAELLWVGKTAAGNMLDGRQWAQFPDSTGNQQLLFEVPK